jgi:predicted GNAT family acetyltransferase/glutaredoxin
MHGLMADASLILYQAEWCPFSSAVREILTELGLDYQVRQVEPWPEQRERLRAAAGTDGIPVLQDEQGVFHKGTRAIFAHLQEREPWRFAAAHRRRFTDHRDARESGTVDQLLEHFGKPDEPEPPPGVPADAEVVQLPEQSRYELRLHGRTIGVLAYHRKPGRIAFTHTEIDRACERRGFGSHLVARALDDALRDGLEVAPLCPFVRHYIERHPKYAPLVAAGHRRGALRDPD